MLIMATVAIARAQNGLQEGNLFILPKDKEHISINIWKQEQIKEIQSLKISPNAIYATDQKMRVVIIDTANDSIHLYNLNSKKDTTFSMPFKMKMKSVLLDDHNLFVGGEMQRELLAQYHIKTKQWYALEIPEEVLHPGKAIDDLVVNDSLLIAIDNIVTPKYVLYYRLEQQGKLSFSHYKELKFNGAYENIHQARITSQYLGLRSNTFSGYSGAGNHITIYDGLDLAKSFSISTRQPDKDFHTFQDFVIVGDILLIASKERGLGRLKIKESYFKGGDKNHNDFSNFDIGLHSVRYTPYQDNLIKKLTMIPHIQKVIVTTEQNEGQYLHNVLSDKLMP